MRLPVKLALLLAATTAFPLVLATAYTVPQGREAMRNQLDQIYAQDARALAAEVHRTLVDKLDALTLAASTVSSRATASNTSASVIAVDSWLTVRRRVAPRPSPACTLR